MTPDTVAPAGRVPHRHGIVVGLHLFNALSAIGGGIALIVGLIDIPSWVAATGFPDLYFPGVILLAVVGGSSLIAALAAGKRVVGWELTSLVAAVVMGMWIVGEIVSIRGFHFLQVVYLVTAVAAAWLTPGHHPPRD